MKIFIGLKEISGYLSNLNNGFRELGISSIYLTLWEHPYQYESAGKDSFAQLLEKTVYKRKILPDSKVLTRLIRAGIRIVIAIWAAYKFDTFIFVDGISFWNLLDLPLLKLLHKKIIFIFLGSSSRPNYAGYPGVEMGTLDIIKQTSLRKRIFRKVEKYADIVIQAPSYAHLWEKQQINLYRLGFPCDLGNRIDTEIAASSDDRDVRILHSPSHPEIKGTPLIRSAIQKLQSKGYLIDFVEITGQPNRIVVQELARCDFVVDQAYSDAPVASFAVEAAFLGKPVVIAGYGQEVTRQMTPASWLPPTLFCRPDELEEAIEKMIVEKDYRLELGKQAKEFVRTHWSPRKVAERYLQILEGNIPPEWWFNPRELRHIYGSGLPIDKMRALIRRVVEAGGKEALCLLDKPELERLLVEFAFSDTQNSTVP